MDARSEAGERSSCGITWPIRTELIGWLSCHWSQSNSRRGTLQKRSNTFADCSGENQHPLPHELAAVAEQTLDVWEERQTETAKIKLAEMIQLAQRIGYL